jgi:hypothetical protein
MAGVAGYDNLKSIGIGAAVCRAVAGKVARTSPVSKFHTFSVRSCEAETARCPPFSEILVADPRLQLLLRLIFPVRLIPGLFLLRENRRHSADEMSQNSLSHMCSMFDLSI